MTTTTRDRLIAACAFNIPTVLFWLGGWDFNTRGATAVGWFVMMIVFLILALVGLHVFEDDKTPPL